jgi:trehalose 6-phosphate synthase
MSRLVVVSNRVALPKSDGAMPAGGLAVAVNASLRERGGMWFGWSGETCEGRPKDLEIFDVGPVLYALQDLPKEDFEAHYNGYCNRVLWPLFHYRLDLMKFDAAELQAYLRVNRLFAERLSKLIAPDDVIWVHDYHLMPLARRLRELGVRNRIGFFLHIPCPAADILGALPRHEDVVGALADYDLVGFQTATDQENFGRYLERTENPRSPRTGVFPVGIETETFASQAAEAGDSQLAREIQDSLAGRKLIIGVDRLDYSKGLPNRLEAFERLLERWPDWRGKVTYLQIAPKSRSEIPEYAEMDRFLGMKTGQINGRFGEPAWTPVRYVNRNIDRTALAGLYRAADVGLVTPLRDGMNLVAKEYLAAQDPNAPGALVLSELAGSAAEISAGALMVNPYDADGMATALDRALRMPRKEKRDRLDRVLPILVRNDIAAWSDKFLGALEQPLSDRGRLGERPVLRAGARSGKGRPGPATDILLPPPDSHPLRANG